MDLPQVLVITLMNDAIVALNGVTVYFETLSDNLMVNTADDVAEGIGWALNVEPIRVDLYDHEDREAFMERHGIDDEWQYDDFVRAAQVDLQDMI